MPRGYEICVARDCADPTAEVISFRVKYEALARAMKPYCSDSANSDSAILSSRLIDSMRAA